MSTLDYIHTLSLVALALIGATVLAAYAQIVWTASRMAL